MRARPTVTIRINSKVNLRVAVEVALEVAAQLVAGETKSASPAEAVALRWEWVAVNAALVAAFPGWVAAPRKANATACSCL